MLAIVIGRHTGEIPGIDIVEQKNVQFPARSNEVLPIIRELVDEAQAVGAKLLLQNTPGQVAVAIALLKDERPVGPLVIGIVINTPGERLAGVEMNRDFTTLDNRLMAEEMVRFANPRVKVQLEDDYSLTVTADPPMRFEYSHIEWL